MYNIYIYIHICLAYTPALLDWNQLSVREVIFLHLSFCVEIGAIVLRLHVDWARERMGNCSAYYIALLHRHTQTRPALYTRNIRIKFVIKP